MLTIAAVLVLWYLVLTIFNVIIRKTLAAGLNLRVYINKAVSKVAEGECLSRSAFRGFWGPMLFLFFYPFLGNLIGISKEVYLNTLPFIGFFPLVFSVLWLLTHKISARNVLLIISALLVTPIVVVMQLLSIAFNIFIVFSTSKNYEGKIKYIPITPK